MFDLGPKWLPILGSALTVNSLRKQTGYLYRATICLAESYGPIVGLKVGKDRQVVCCGYNAIKEMLTKEEFDGRPQGPFYETRTWGTRRGITMNISITHIGQKTVSIIKLTRSKILNFFALTQLFGIGVNTSPSPFIHMNIVYGKTYVFHILVFETI